MGSVHPSVGVRPNLTLNADPACIVFRSFSSSRFLGFAQRLGAGGLRLASFVSRQRRSGFYGFSSNPHVGSLIAPKDFVPPRLAPSARNSQRRFVTPLRHVRIVSPYSAAFPFSSDKSGATLRTFGHPTSLPTRCPHLPRLRSRLTFRSTRTLSLRASVLKQLSSQVPQR